VLDLEFIWKTPGSIRDNTVWNDSDELTNARHKYINLDQIAARFTLNLSSFRQPTPASSALVHASRSSLLRPPIPLSTNIKQHATEPAEGGSVLVGIKGLSSCVNERQHNWDRTHNKGPHPTHLPLHRRIPDSIDSTSFFAFLAEILSHGSSPRPVCSSHNRHSSYEAIISPTKRDLFSQ